MSRILCVAAALAIFAAPSLEAAPALRAPSFIVQASNDLPITTFNLTFRVGSADDPAGLEGLAYVTARLLREGGVRELKLGERELPARTRAELEEFLFPLAADIGLTVEKEQVSFAVTTTRENAETVLGVLAQLLTAPAFSSGELDRIRGEVLDELTKQLPREDEEELGKAALDRTIYGPKHPYGHAVEGTVSGVRAVDLDAVKEFYRTRFTRARLTVGLAGVVPAELEHQAAIAFLQLPEGTATRAEIPPAPAAQAVHLTLVKGPFDAVGAHLGEALPVNRAHPDFPALFLASWAFGKHRSFVGRLMNHVREIRGLNYGTYSYVEDFPNGGEHMIPPTQGARTRQAFTVWARPTPVPNGCFLLRQIYRETSLLASKGLTAKEFELAKSHLVGNAPLLATGIARRLGYAIDSSFYGITGDFLRDLQISAQKLTHAQVNERLRHYLHPGALELVVVTPDPERFKTEALGPRCGISYAPGISKASNILKEDQLISTYPLGLSPDRISITESSRIFEK